MHKRVDSNEEMLKVLPNFCVVATLVRLHVSFWRQHSTILTGNRLAWIEASPSLFRNIVQFKCYLFNDGISV